MATDVYPFPVAVSQLGEQDSRESQNTRAITWLLAQPGGSIVVVTPRKQFAGESLKGLVARPDTTHLTWRGFSAGSLANHRAIYAWPNRQHLNDLWGVNVDALVVLEWGQVETSTWIEDARPVRLLPGRTVQSSPESDSVVAAEPLPEGVGRIVEYVAGWPLATLRG